MLQEVLFPDGADGYHILAFLPRWHALMYQMDFFNVRHISASTPLWWPLGDGRISFWRDGARRIILTPNITGWALACGAVIMMLIFRSGNAEAMLLVGFFLNYLPFFFIHRALFLYHYFPSLIFAYLLVPRATRLLGFSKTSVPILFFVALTTLFLAPVTYGMLL